MLSTRYAKFTLHAIEGDGLLPMMSNLIATFRGFLVIIDNGRIINYTVAASYVMDCLFL